MTILIPLIAGALIFYQYGVCMPLDSHRLLEPVREDPFHLRWLLPWITRRKFWVWTVLSWGSALAICWKMTPWEAALFCSLPWFRLMIRAPILVDAPALLGSLALSVQAPMVSSCGSILLSGISERVPVFAALYAWSPWPLVGFIPVAIVHMVIKKKPSTEGRLWLRGCSRRMRWTEMKDLILPWGAGCAAIFATDWSVQEVTILIVSYAQLFIAHDQTRLYMWASPVVLPKALSVIPPRLRPLAVLVSWFNPWKRVGPNEVMV